MLLNFFWDGNVKPLRLLTKQLIDYKIRKIKIGRKSNEKELKKQKAKNTRNNIDCACYNYNSFIDFGTE